MRLPVRIALRQEGLLAKWFNRGRLLAIELCADGHLGVEFWDGERVQCVVSPSTVVHPFLIVLRFSSRDGAGVLVLNEALITREDHRRLRVWLKTRALTRG